jgi:methylmalonyl-CoA mutase
MAATSEPFALAADFAEVSREDWRNLVRAVLTKSGALAEGGDPEQALTHTTYDGIAIAPLYTAADAPAAPTGTPGAKPFVRGSTVDGATATGWDVRQRHHDPSAARTRQAALDDLANGVTSLWLVLGEGGLAVADLPAALDGVYLDLAPIALDAGAATEAAAAALLDLAATKGVATTELAGTLGADPIGLRARTGSDPDLALLGRLAVLVAASPRLRVATVDGTVYHDAGASDADELAIATSVGVAYLRALEAAGVDLARAFELIEFRYAVTDEQFGSIAKLRAARQVWGRIAELCGITPVRGQYQHAATSAAMVTQRDPWVNMLRTTIACFAAAVGGADAITVLPFDHALGLPDDFSRRIARNTQSVLHDESSLARVVDAAGGSWFVESLTAELAAAAWAKFTALEAAGGALAALDGGHVGALLDATVAKRDADIAHRRAPITGVSEFALITEAPVLRPQSPASPIGGPLTPRRYAADFEALRDASDGAAQRPRIFLAAIGPYAAHSGRAAFATNLFQGGGIEAVTGDGDPAAIVMAFKESGTSVACLCSSDKLYAESAAALAAALKAAGASTVLLAGKPGGYGDVDDYIFAGCDALAALRSALHAMGVSA